MVFNMTKNPKVKSKAISTHIIGKYLDQGSAEKLQWHSLQKNDSGMQANIQSENTQVKVETTTTIENSYFGQTLSNSLVLLQYEREVSLILDSLLRNPMILKVKQSKEVPKEQLKQLSWDTRRSWRMRSRVQTLTTNN